MGTKKTKVLVASTDPAFLNGSLSELKADFDVQVATSIDVAQFLIKEWEPEIGLVDGDCPSSSALAGIRSLRPLDSFGLVVLSSSPNSFKEERAFREGADYFLPSGGPYRSLHLRIASLSRRLSQSTSKGGKQASADQVVAAMSVAQEAISFLDIRIFPQDYLVKRHQDLVNTTPTQFRLLLAFVSHPEQLLSREWLREHVWENAKISHRSIDAQISKLKKQIPELDRHLVNVYGKGYILTQPQQDAA
ncbi:MAG: response regulator transcription factor [Bdellovibrionaceae bacterium]|nr:response regulator transcription factor [Bdellovibrionales bacterium]MCB9086076.1 response regulator transcription factor [Pseudobdellovibrionaceae bacterium]